MWLIVIRWLRCVSFQVDVHQDSTRILDDMLTPYQRNLMDIVFNNDTENRGKVQHSQPRRLKGRTLRAL